MLSVVPISQAKSPTRIRVHSLIQWESRYDGVLMIARFGRDNVAGISGPWPEGRYALTWWGPTPFDRSLEMFDNAEAAMRRVEKWADGLRCIS